MIKLVSKILLLIMLTVGPLLVLNYTIDPLQCFRPATWYKPLYDPNQRVQSPCLVRTYEYDTLIIGASHVENFDPIYIDEVFGVKTLRAAIAGSTLNEQNKLLNLAFQVGKVKNIVWGLDTNILHDDPNRVRDDIIPFPYYIYEPNLYNNFIFLLDPYHYKHYLKMVTNRTSGIYSDFEDLRYLNYWADKFVFSKERTLEFFTLVKDGMVEAMQNTNTNLEMSDLVEISTENIDKNVIEPVKNNPEVNFYIFFPPYSILRFVDLYNRDRELFEIEFKLKEHLICSLTNYPNAHVFDFQQTEAITHNLDNYKDLAHFSSSTNRYVIEHLKTGGGRIKPENCYSTLSLIRKQVEEYSQVE